MSDPNTLKNCIVWADIPVKDLDRAAGFYRDVLALGVHREESGPTPFCVFQHDQGNGGCLVLQPGDVSASGMLTYFNVDGRIREALALVEAKGGHVLQPLHGIGPHGFRAVILDSEGNRIALHSQVDA
ncbi:VOC family protein [Mesoterricola silvestris]|uniref:Glyoxalase n=1 Tax=Mesoterricola silvestris TaxID=2927979 RepID=A0AA48GJI4_9BACT|nr:VOC family protein [Mesoterricola silvestris]BDU74156.1 glyoxalase [Mesoterricola silvestris]